MVSMNNFASFYRNNIYIYIRKAVSSAVERLPYKQRVTGSNPVLPIYNFNNKSKIFFLGSSSKGLGRKPSKFLM